MVNAIFSTDQSARSYMLLFWEAINRANVVSSIINNGTNLPPPIAREICYLQFRKICEMLALGSLFLHGDLPETRKLADEWNADKIMKRLAHLHVDFFPRSADIRLDETSGRRVWKVKQDANPNALKQHELKKLYTKCGEELHRGKIKNLEFISPTDKISYDDITFWQKKIVALLNGHFVTRANRKGFYFFDAKDASGTPVWSIGEYTDGGVAIRFVRTSFSPQEA